MKASLQNKFIEKVYEQSEIHGNSPDIRRKQSAIDNYAKTKKDDQNESNHRE